MKANLLILAQCFEVGNTENLLESIENLLLVKEKSLKKGDKLWCEGYADIDIFEKIITLYGNKKINPEVRQAIKILLEKNVIPIYENFEGIKDNHFIVEYTKEITSFREKPLAFLGINFVNLPIAIDEQIGNIANWFRFHRHCFIASPPEQKNFTQAINPYFENLCFSNCVNPNCDIIDCEYACNSVNRNLNTLHCDYKQIIKTILYHLTAINDDFAALYNENRSKGANQVCTILETHYAGKDVKLGCSPEDDKNLQELYFRFSYQNIEKTVYCDLHTKVWKYFEYVERGQNEDKGDRIYFCEPQLHELPNGKTKIQFAEGKILVGKIGEHRTTKRRK